MSRRIQAILIGIILICFNSTYFGQVPQPKAQSQDQTTKQNPSDDSINLSTELVVVDATVLQKKTGRMVGGLKKEDFELYEDGVKQEITHFSQDKLPISVVLLFDLTDTVQPVLKQLAAGALEALNHLKPEDEVSVMVYAAAAKLIQGFTTDRQKTAEAIKTASEMTSEDAAFFNEGVFQASAQLRKATNPVSRRVIIWLTDNLPNSPSPSMRKWAAKDLPPDAHLHTEQEAFTELFESGVMTSSIVERSGETIAMEILIGKNPIFAIGRHKNHPGNVYNYADQTGGEVVKANKADISERLAELIDHIRTRYTLGYVPTNNQSDGKLKRIKVKLTSKALAAANDKDLVVKARQGYYRKAVVVK